MGSYFTSLEIVLIISFQETLSRPPNLKILLNIFSLSIDLTNIEATSLTCIGLKANSPELFGIKP